MRNRFRLLLLLLPLALLPCLSAARAGDARPGPLVFAAASLTDVLQQVGADYGQATGTAVRFSFGSSATLARQIESGARAEVFVAADVEWMDYVEQRALLRRASRRDLLGNRLVLVAPATSALRLAVAPGLPLRTALGGAGRLALADPASVPAGKYAKAALTALGAWREVEDRIVVADNVRVALMYVARGEAPLGIVYLTDARTEPRVRIVGAFPAASHPPIVYPAALTTSASAGAAEFLAYLSGPAARRRFEAAGFVRAPAPASASALTPAPTPAATPAPAPRPAGTG